VVQDKDAPTTLGDITIISRNKRGQLLAPPSHGFHTVGMDIGYGEGTSPGGYKYALTLIDYATRHTWTYGLKNKTVESVIDARWCFFVDAGGVPKRIRCDFDSSFVKGKTYKFLTTHKIKVTSAPPKRQSRNGLVERQWQTAVAMAQAMLIKAQLPQRYWFWALRKSVIRMNLLPCKPTGKATVQQGDPSSDPLTDPLSDPLTDPLTDPSSDQSVSQSLEDPLSVSPLLDGHSSVHPSLHFDSIEWPTLPVAQPTSTTVPPKVSSSAALVPSVTDTSER
jgi:hypothetical protein